VCTRGRGYVHVGHVRNRTRRKGVGLRLGRRICLNIYRTSDLSQHVLRHIGQYVYNVGPIGPAGPDNVRDVGQRCRTRRRRICLTCRTHLPSPLAMSLCAWLGGAFTCTNWTVLLVCKFLSLLRPSTDGSTRTQALSSGHPKGPLPITRIPLPPLNQANASTSTRDCNLPGSTATRPRLVSQISLCEEGRGGRHCQCPPSAFCNAALRM
jgi:hypothetical protein